MSSGGLIRKLEKLEKDGRIGGFVRSDEAAGRWIVYGPSTGISWYQHMTTSELKAFLRGAFLGR